MYSFKYAITIAFQISRYPRNKPTARLAQMLMLKSYEIKIKMLDFLSLNTNIPLLPIFIILQLDHIILYLMGLVRRNNNNTAHRTLSTDRYSRRQTCIHCPGEIGGGRYVLQRHLPPLQTHLHSSPVRQSISFSVRGRAHVPEMMKMCIGMYQTGRGQFTCPASLPPSS